MRTTAITKKHTIFLVSKAGTVRNGHTIFLVSEADKVRPATKLEHRPASHAYLHLIHHFQYSHGRIMLVELLVNGDQALEAGGRVSLELQLSVVQSLGVGVPFLEVQKTTRRSSTSTSRARGRHRRRSQSTTEVKISILWVNSSKLEFFICILETQVRKRGKTARYCTWANSASIGGLMGRASTSAEFSHPVKIS